MTYYILIAFCIVVLLAYTFEVTASFSKIPGVIFLMILGLISRYLTPYFGLEIREISELLPVMGTLGLILIVLEGSMDLTLSKENKKLIINSFASAILLFISFIILFTLVIYIFFHSQFKTALLNAIPFSVISSAVAIPASTYLLKSDREFIIYESSVSDIIAILLFDFVLFSRYSVGKALMVYSVEVIASIVFSVIISAALALMLHKISHHVKYVIILTSVILIFALAKLIHWPALIVVLIFGLIMNNSHLFQTKYIKDKIDFNEFNLDLKAFKQITAELTFLVRSFFFLIFGFYTSLADLINFKNLVVSVSICISIYLLRGLFFKYILRKSLTPLLYFAPRGLLTILLFLSITDEFKLPFMSEGLITQTIFITIIVMAFGNLISKKQKDFEMDEKTSQTIQVS